jgi:hypothetical protein
MKVGFTGTRHGMNSAQMVAFHSILLGGGGELHHGDCVGADVEAARLAKGLGFRIIGHPPSLAGMRAHFPSDEEREPRAYMVRNQSIVNECEMLIAAPAEDEEQQFGGTWATVRKARKAGKPIWLLLPTKGPSGPGAALPTQQHKV